MKYIITCSLLILFFFVHTEKIKPAVKELIVMNKDTSVIQDSLDYMKGIVANKQKYINKPFSVLLNDLKIPVKSYRSSHSNRIENIGIRISFDNDYTTTAKSMNYPSGYKNPVGLNIEWVSKISRQEIDSKLKYEAGEWTMAEQNYYGSQIVSDIIPWSLSEK